MNVVYVTMSFPAPSETFASTDITALRRAGVRVTVHAFLPAHPQAAQLIETRDLHVIATTYGDRKAVTRGLKAAFFKPGLSLDLLLWILHHNWKKPRHILKSLILSPRALDVFLHIREARPEVVHLYWGHYPSLVGHLVQKNMPHTVLSISLGAYDLRTGYKGSGAVARKADIVRTLAQVNIDYISKAFHVPRERVTVLYDGVNLEKFREQQFDHKIKRRIVTAGRLVRFKGMHTVLEVFGAVLRRWPDASLVILGDGPERETLEAQAQSLGVAHAVSFRGHVDHHEVFTEMAQAEVFLYLSALDRLPNVVKEAIGCRCLCIVAHTPGMDELLFPGEHGFIVPQGDVKAAKHQLERVFSGEVPVDALTEAAYRHLERHFNVDRIMHTYVMHWRRLLAEKGTRGSRDATPRQFHEEP